VLRICADARLTRLLGCLTPSPIVTDHTTVDYELVLTKSPLAVGTRNVTARIKDGREKVVRCETL
jgi:hypothetical protein